MRIHELKVLLERQRVNWLVEIVRGIIVGGEWKFKLIYAIFLKSRLRVEKIVVEKSVLD